MSTAHYDPVEVRDVFRHLSEFGYNTVRIFFDICSQDPSGFTNSRGDGLNPGYLDNMADLMRIAGEEGIYVVFTANAIPDGGGYWPYFDSIFFSGDRAGFDDGRNADWLHEAGVETKRKVWRDLLEGLAEREAPFEVVLGWSLTNEYWLWGDEAPPFTLTEGEVTTANGTTYDMADPAQKQRMAVDGALYFIDQIVATIKELDPEGLTTMGFYAPYFRPTGYIVTPDIIDVAPLDFWDFHAYYGSDLTIEEQAESFGMVGYEEKPIIMGETASGYENVPSTVSALQFGLEWIAASCEMGFDGWLYWGYYPWPEDVGGKAWAMLEDDQRIFEGMSPRNQPDPCVVPELEVSNIAHRRPVRASSFSPDQPAEAAVDGTNRSWNAGNLPTQWIEIGLDESSTVAAVGMTVDQWPPGITRHRVEATLADGSVVLLGRFERFTAPSLNLNLQVLGGLAEVRAIRITTESSPAWVAWREIEVVSAPAGSAADACIGTVSTSLEWSSEPVAGARTVGSTSSGQQVVIDGIYVGPDGNSWLRTGGDTWTLADSIALDGTCGVETVEPSSPLVFVTFEVDVPPGTPGEIFMSGVFPGVRLDPWIPYMIPLTDRGGGTWTVDMLLPEGSEIQYVYTRSDWETIERPDTTCTDMPPRTVTIAAGTTVTDTVVRWRDIDCGGG
jgi:hypothetical protein